MCQDQRDRLHPKVQYNYCHPITAGHIHIQQLHKNRKLDEGKASEDCHLYLTAAFCYTFVHITIRPHFPLSQLRFVLHP